MLALARQQNHELLTLQSDSKTGNKAVKSQGLLTLLTRQRRQCNWPRFSVSLPLLYLVAEPNYLPFQLGVAC